MDVSPSASSTPATPNTTSYALEDSDGADTAVIQDAGTDGQQGQETTPDVAAKPAQPDPDKVILEVSRRDRESRQRAQVVDRKAQELTKREAELNARSESVQKFAALQAKAKSDPYEAAVEIAALLGIDADELTEAVVTKTAGGTVKKLDASERVTRLEQELAAKDAAAEARSKAEAEKAAEAAGDAKINAHLGQLESLAKASENFPLVAGESPGELTANVNEAFDLMVLSWQAEKQGQTGSDGQPIKQLTHVQALNIVEQHLRQKTEARARKLGLTAAAKPSPAADTDISVTARTPQATAQASPRNGLSPITATASIKSDDDILADFQL